MESILSMHDEVYPIKSRRNKSSSYLRHSFYIRRNTLNQTNSIFSVFYQYIRRMVAQRTLYILGILNLILAGIAILCVTHAEDHPEYFSLVYIAISIFIFYMLTILLIIILQIIETYQEKPQRNHSETSFISSQIPVQTKPIIVESMITKTQAKTHLSRSQTLPLASSLLIIPHQTFSTSTSSSTLKDFTSTRYTLLPANAQINLKPPRNYQPFPLTTNNQYSPLNSNHSSQLSSLIKPIPMNYLVNNENKNTKIHFLK